MKKKLIRVVTADVSFGLTQGQLKFLSETFEVIAVSSAGERLDLVFKTEGVRTQAIEISRPISILNDVKSLYSLYKFFKKESPDIVHSMTPKAGLLSMVAAYFAKVPVRIHTFTGLIFPSKNGFLKKLLIAMDKTLCLCATKIIPEGNGVKNDLISHNITSKPLHVIANGNINGVDLAYYNSNIFNESFKLKLREDLKIHKDDYVFTFAGRLVGDKGMNELVAAFNLINSNLKKTKLLLIGSFEEALDPLEPETKKQIKLNENIITTGWVSDVRPYFAIANCLTFPSYREGFPNVVLQACALKLPCIVTNINGSNEIISEPENGLIIPVKNTEALYKAMEKMYHLSTEAHAKMGETSQNIIISKFEQQFVWNALLEEYKNLLNLH
ncbi:glycosyltransferase family 4 protein [Mariniflexile litorale]|uniref:Glycosyltransferase family 4 protein n=1 Tax=Mariniflexile litorale TaxID=3045158 RepID=A0AAU7EFS0_9FLAO|nr:glycosyltransferase family 4 protein [Mariniflexile sp. KMM 9835]MDQ8211520.1 glycosyltransferase family 4 protein [Mariniflexile sp. KMM 9835]